MPPPTANEVSRELEMLRRQFETAMARSDKAEEERRQSRTELERAMGENSRATDKLFESLRRDLDIFRTEVRISGEQRARLEQEILTILRGTDRSNGPGGVLSTLADHGAKLAALDSRAGRIESAQTDLRTSVNALSVEGGDVKIARAKARRQKWNTWGLIAIGAMSILSLIRGGKAPDPKDLIEVLREVRVLDDENHLDEK